tara:strand:+ start:148 stop:342 length:195 start_codon:yes stop_codon:yes gene_type:complete
MLTRIHFIKIAELTGSVPMEQGAFDTLVVKLGDFCQQQNPRFHRGRFTQAAQLSRSKMLTSGGA